MTEYVSMGDVPGLHFSVKEGLENNLKFSGNVNANPDIAGEVNGEPQTVFADNMGFLWRTKSDNLNIVRSAKVVGLDLAAKLASQPKFVAKYSHLNKSVKAIYVVKHGDKLLDERGHDIDMIHVQRALWLRADGLAPFSQAKVALKKMYAVDSKGWTGHVHPVADLELIELLLVNDVEIASK